MANGEFAQILQEAVDKGQRMWRTAGNVKIDPVLLYELAREFVGPLKNAAADGAGAEKNQQFRSRHGLVSRFQSVRHRACGRSGDDNAIRVSGQREESIFGVPRKRSGKVAAATSGITGSPWARRTVTALGGRQLIGFRPAASSVMRDSVVSVEARKSHAAMSP